MAQYGVIAEASKSVWGFDPTSIPGCIMWLDAADRNSFSLDANNALNSVRDKSVLQLNMTSVKTTPSTNGFRWLSNNFNGSYPSFYTTASVNSSIAQTDALASYGTPLTIFVVAKYDGPSSGSNSFVYDSLNRIALNGPISTNGNTSGLAAGTTSSSTISQSPFPSGGFTGGGSVSPGPFIQSIVLSAGTNGCFMFSNGSIALVRPPAGNLVTSGSLTAPVTFGTTLKIGSRHLSGSSWFGKISEVLFYNNVLTNAERQQVEGYLASKWRMQGLLPATHPYSNIYPVVLPRLRQFQPTEVSSPCLLWFDGADINTLTLSGSNVTAWRDKSGSANNIPSFSGTQPVYNSSTGFLTMKGSGTTSNNIALTSTSSYSVFYVITFLTGLTDTGGSLFARPFQLSGTPTYFVGFGRGGYTVSVSGASISGSNTTYNVTNTSGLTTGNTVTIEGITLGSATGYNGTGVVQSFVSNTSITVNITSTGTPTSYSGSTARNGTSNVSYYLEGNGGSGPYYFFASGQGFNTYSGSTFVVSFSRTGATTYTLSVNGNQSLPTATTSTMANRQVVITGNGGTPTFELGEVLLYDGALSTQDIQRINGYLIWKWRAQRSAYPGVDANIKTSHPFYRFPTPTTTPFTPILLGNTYMWYDGADTSSLTLSGSTITAWNDKSGNGNNLTVAVGPTRTATTSNPAGWDISFNGSTQYIRSNAVVANGTNTMTVFIVVKNTTSATLGRIIAGITNGPETNETGAFRFANAGTNLMAITKGNLSNNGQDGTNYTISSDVYHIISITWNGASNSPIFVDGSLNGTYGSNSNTTFSFTRFGLGASLGTTATSFTPATFWTGSLNEAVIYKSAISTTQRQQVEGYLAWKWGIKTALPTTHPYYNISP